jgi:hypothetical protein
MQNRERTWKLVSTLSGMLGAVIAKKIIKAVYGAVRKDTDPDSPFEPADRRFSLGNALLWAVAAGVGLGVAKVVSNRVAAIGWEVATGTPPPGIDEKPTP